MRRRWRDSGARQDLIIALGLCGLMWLAGVSFWLWNGETVPWDSKNQFYAFFRFLSDSLHAGRSFFWNPYHFGGHPAIADPQSLIFSPPFLLWAWLDQEPSIQAFDILVFLHVLVGGAGIVLMGWRAGWPTAASLLSASLYMLGGAASARLQHTGIIVCYALFPPALLLLEIVVERGSKAAGLGFAVVASMIILGRNQVALMLCLVLAVLGLRMVFSAPHPLALLRQRAGLLAAILIGIIAMTAVPLLLTMQLAKLSNRPTVALADALQASLHPANLASMFAPNVFGALNTDGSYWGPGSTTVPEVSATDDSFNYMFVGVVPVVLLSWLGIAGRRLLAKGNRVWLVLLTGALAFAVGRYTPLYAFVFEDVPGFSYFRRPIDAAFIVDLAIAIISGALLTTYVRDGLPKVTRWPATLALAVIAAVMLAAIGVGRISGHGWATAAALAKSVVMMALVVGVLAAGQRYAARSPAAIVLAVIAVAELIHSNAASPLNAQARADYRVIEQASAEDAKALAILEREIEQRHRDGARPRVEIIGLGGPWQNLSMVRKLEVTTGYNPLRIGIYDRYVSPGEANAFSDERTFPATFSGYDCALARALGLEYVVLDRPLEKLPHLKKIPRADVLLAGPRIWIYRLKGAAPRVKFAANMEVADLDLRIARGDVGREPSDDVAVIDDETPPSRFQNPRSRSQARGKARLVRWAPDRVEVEAEAPVAGVVVLNDIFYPGWIAEVDGKPKNILRADALFRAVEVTAGRHRIVFRFAPLSRANLTSAVKGLLGRGSDDPNAEPSY
ncbi:MAG: 6-pyruvoyl-tetrahydropterin synthase-related protein [Hyphomicrobiaceae bacterium]